MRPRLHSSLRTRLALWHLLVLGLVLAFFGAGIFLEVRQSLLGGVDTALVSRAATVAEQVVVDDGPNAVSYPRDNDAPAAQANIAVYLFDAHGRLRDRVAGSTDLPPRPNLLGAALHDRGGFVTAGTVRLYVLGVPDGDGDIVGAVQVEQSLGPVFAQIDRLLLLLLLAIPALLTVATAGGIFLAGRALAPIDRIVCTAQQIKAGTLHGRLSLAPRDDEVGRLAATFDEMLDRLEDAFAQQRRFVADASHELRTPLAIVRSDLDILLRRPRSLAEHQEFAQGLDGEITRLSTLVDGLLTLARADSGQIELERTLIEIDELVASAVQGVRRLAAAKGVEVIEHLQGAEAVIGDASHLRQLVLNVLGNAVKYTPEGGRVRVTLRHEADDVVLEIADTGIGIAPHDLPHIFERFYRADKARGRAEGGTGLGLAIARWCAEAHGGRIVARSEPGVGSTFIITLPRVAAAEAPPLPDEDEREEPPVERARSGRVVRLRAGALTAGWSATQKSRESADGGGA